MPIRLKGDQFKHDAVEAVRRCLADVPFVQIRDVKSRSTPDEPRPGLIVRLKLPDGAKTIVADLNSSGQPRLARQAVVQIADYLSRFKNAYGVFIAPYVSERSAAICADAGIGFVDLAGNCRLCFDQVYVRRTGAINPYAEKRDLRSLYSPKATRVLRVWLSAPGRPWRVQELANEADVSLGQASNVKKLLDDRDWVESVDEGFRLTEPEALLLDWAANQQYRRDKLWQCYALERPPEIESRIAERCAERSLQYALTGFSAAARLAPMVRASRVSSYVAGDVPRMLKALGFKRVASGANVTLIEPGDAGVFYGSRTFDNIVIVSAVQAYLDLKRQGGRGDEAADAILCEIIRKQW